MRLISLLLVLWCTTLYGESMHRQDWFRLGAAVLRPPPVAVSVNTPTVSVQANHGRICHRAALRWGTYQPQPYVHCPRPTVAYRPQPVYIQRFPLHPKPVYCYHPPPEPIQIVREPIVVRRHPPPEHRLVIVVVGKVRSYQIE